MHLLFSELLPPRPLNDLEVLWVSASQLGLKYAFLKTVQLEINRTTMAAVAVITATFLNGRMNSILVPCNTARLSKIALRTKSKGRLIHSHTKKKIILTYSPFSFH